jgi:DNA invertase Pin-like site-specific DNA recombinase
MPRVPISNTPWWNAPLRWDGRSSRVEIIDEDLGKSGAQAEARGGFQRLLAEISLASVGLVLSFDASRLARNNHDWYQLLEVCSIFGTLIADGERLYDPRLYHDRLLLGLYVIYNPEDY